MCVFLLAANGAVQNSGKRNQDEGVLKRRAGSGPEGGPGPEREGGGRHVADGELLLLLCYFTLFHFNQSQFVYRENLKNNKHRLCMLMESLCSFLFN